MRQKNSAHKLGILLDEKYVKILFVLCWTVYCTSYLGRLNYSSAMTLMISEGIVDASSAGFISMLYFFAYGVGQMVNGFLGDYVNPKKMIFNGLFFSGIANILMGIFHQFFFMCLIWGLNGYFQAMIWAPIIRIFAEMLDEKSKINCSVNIVTSQIIGTLLAYLLSAGILMIFPWPSVFESAAIFLIAVAFIWAFGFTKLCSHAKQQTETEKVKVEQPQKEITVISFRSLMINSGIAIMFIPVIVHGMLKDGVTAWVPTYITESFTVSPSFSILLTTVLPVINLTGAYMARYTYRRVKKNIAKSVSIFFAAATAALLLLFIVGKLSPILSVLFLAIITASMMAVNTLIVNIYPLRFQKYGRVSGVSGFLNALAYLGTATSTYTIGILVQYKGWHVTILSWFLITAFAGITCLLAIKSKKMRGECI